MERAKSERLAVRAYVSCVLGCPYEGPVPPQDVVKVRRLKTSPGSVERDGREAVDVDVEELMFRGRSLQGLKSKRDVFERTTSQGFGDAPPD